MNSDISKKEQENNKGKRLLEKVKLEYSKEIINEIDKNPAIIPDLLSELELTEEDFLNCIYGQEEANITTYDQILVTSMKKNKEYNKDTNKYFR